MEHRIDIGSIKCRSLFGTCGVGKGGGNGLGKRLPGHKKGLRANVYTGLDQTITTTYRCTYIAVLITTHHTSLSPSKQLQLQFNTKLCIYIPSTLYVQY